MIMENKQLRIIARNTLRGKWGMGALITLIVMIISVALYIPYLGVIIGVLVVLPLTFGFTVHFLQVMRGENFEVGKIFQGFNQYGRILGTTLLVEVYTFLWLLLLIVPGIIKMYSYSMTPYVLLDEPELSYNAAIEKSMAMMCGHKMKLFLLDLSFIGWFLLSLLSLGIGFFWLIPYVRTAHAAFYEDLKRELA